jgi:transposase-like protein
LTKAIISTIKKLNPGDRKMTEPDTKGQETDRDQPDNKAETGFIRTFPKCPFCGNDSQVGENETTFVFLFMNRYHCHACDRRFA